MEECWDLILNLLHSDCLCDDIMGDLINGIRSIITFDYEPSDMKNKRLSR